MKIKALFTLLFFLFAVSAFAQNSYNVKGMISDSVEHIKLERSAVSILQAKDSILVKFCFTNADGNFSLNGIGKGKYILLVSCPDYADYAEQFRLDSAKQAVDFGHINMVLRSRLLQEVIVKGTASQMKIKGDTTEFNARAFVIQPNAKVEDLLKQLPVITVDKDGKITAQGQTVSKVLVDGEEFFGDDPTLVTRNIRADMVDKIQLYDKKSDQAAFTGVDDGVKTKTINIKLKEDKKNGVFGELNGNIGTDGYYEGQLLYNRFKANQRFSAYGTMANDGRIGLGFSDASRLGAGNGDIQFVDGGISINTSGNDALDSFSGYYDGKGLPTARSGGVHYDSKWNGEKESLNTNYKLGSIEVEGVTTSIV